MTWGEAKEKANEIMKSLRAQFPPEAVRLILRALSRQYQKDKIVKTEQDNLPEEQIYKCNVCQAGYDVATEDPQFPGLCRDCGDKKRDTK